MLAEKNHQKFALISALTESVVLEGVLTLNLNIATFCFHSSVVSWIREHSYKTLIQGNFILIPAAGEASASCSHLLLHSTYLLGQLSLLELKQPVIGTAPTISFFCFHRYKMAWYSISLFTFQSLSSHTVGSWDFFGCRKLVVREAPPFSREILEEK